ncbi:MAG: phosphate ABC transporter permease subunit PstC [Bdellovibrionales bacterium]|nr:phosphate ABC transporter permease subunit PstC [Bdellovibrionales bacterium]
MLVTIATSLAVVLILGTESFAFFKEVSLIDFLFGTRWEPLLEPKSFGVLPLVSGTGLIVVGSILIALPAGLFVAVYLNEYANYRIRQIVKPALELLAGIPTVVYGYFALTFITPLMKSVFPQVQVFNAFSGAVVVGIMILPMVSSLVDDAFRGVPKSLREGAYAMGANPVEVTTQIILPAIKSRIAAAIILAVSRAVGETMAVTLAAGATAKMTLNPFESIQTMTAYIVQVSLGDTPHGGIEYQTCFAVAALLFVMTFTMNIIGNRFMFNEKRS